MPHRAANVLAAVGSLLLLAAVAVPAIMWPRPAELDVPLRQVAALAVGGVLLLAGVICWVGAVLAKRTNR